MKMKDKSVRYGLQTGAAVTEFAVILVFFMALVIAVVEFARVMYIYSSAVEATRLGARIAVVCSPNDVNNVKARMQVMLNLLQPNNINITYPAAGCSATTCDPITVRIQNVSVSTVIPLVPLTFTLPPFSTSLPSESLDSTNNPICTAP